MGKLHFITYANGKNRNTGLSYVDTQRKLVGSIENVTSKEVVFHANNLDSLKQKDWYKYIEHFPELNPSDFGRDGYYCSYKTMLIKEVYDLMGDDDILYYADSSGYYPEPFKHNIDRLLKYVEHNGHVCGAVGNTVKNGTLGCCDNPLVWDALWPGSDKIIDTLLQKPHILASWLLFTKNKKSEVIINEWVDATINKELDGKPLNTYHHTIDQSLLNILLYKHGDYKVFINDVPHEFNKNNNEVHFRLNNEPNDDIETLEKWFINVNKLEKLTCEDR